MSTPLIAAIIISGVFFVAFILGFAAGRYDAKDTIELLESMLACANEWINQLQDKLDDGIFGKEQDNA